MTRARWWLIPMALVVLAVAGCGAPKSLSGTSRSSKATSKPRVLGLLFSAPKPCSSVVAPGTYSQATLMATQDQVQQVAGDQYISLGLGESTVEVGLMAGREALAAQIAKMFGPKVSITVGLTSYCGGSGRSPACSSMPRGDRLPPGLILDLVIAHRTIKSGDVGNAKLVVSEVGPGTFQMDTGQPLTAEVVRRGTRRVVGISDLPTAGTGYGPKVSPGHDEMIPVVFGTARCDGGLGSAMPRGRYDVVVYIHSEEGEGPVYYAPAVPVVVTG